MSTIAVCIPTFRRPALLAKLMDDIRRQTVQIDRLVVVDGDPSSGQVCDLLTSAANGTIEYVPSNHANLSYQRYLGWRAAAGCDVMIYLDDDIRISQLDALERLIKPFSWPNKEVVGVTGNIVFGDVSPISGESALLDQHQFARSAKSWLVRRLGSARAVPAGGLTPAGHRRMPIRDGRAYAVVTWLHGGVMAYRMDALTQECFSEDLFSLDHIRCGKGEDTFLSRRVGTRGELIIAFCAVFEHPEADLPRAYPTAAYRLGFATAYSRRFLNDHFHPFARPRLGDRLALLQSYLGTAMLAWWRVVRRPRNHRVAYAWGFTMGVLWGMTKPPTARTLAPDVRWWSDADQALHSVIPVLKEDG